LEGKRRKLRFSSGEEEEEGGPGKAHLPSEEKKREKKNDGLPLRGKNKRGKKTKGKKGIQGGGQEESLLMKEVRKR